MSQRPVRRIVGAVACSAALLPSGCTGRSEQEPALPSPTGAAATACSRLLDALPDQVADQPPSGTWTPVSASWGDPPIRLTCGVGRPDGYDDVARCVVARGVDWFVPEDAGATADEVRMTVVHREVYVEVRLPARYLPPATAMADLAHAVKATTSRTGRCR